MRNPGERGRNRYLLGTPFVDVVLPVRPKDVVLAPVGGPGEQNLGGVNITFCHAPVRMGRFQLDVRLRVSGGCLVGEAGVAKPVERLDDLRDSGPSVGGRM